MRPPRASAERRDPRGRRPGAAEPPPKKGTLRGWLMYLLLLTLVVGLFGLAGLSWRQAIGLSRYQPGAAPTPKIQALSTEQAALLAWSGVALPRPVERIDPEAIPVRHEAESFTTPGGVSLASWRLRHDEPAGTVLLVPDHGQTRGSLLPEALAIHAMGWDAMLLDVRGTGAAAGNVTSWGWFEARDVAAAYDRLRARSSVPVVIYGRGAGAAAALRAIATEGIKPDALALESPWPELRTVFQGMMRRLGLPAQLPGHPLVFFFGVHHRISGLDFAPRTYARSAQMPSLVLHGAAHATVTTAEARQVHDALAGERSWAVFGKAGETGTLGSEPQRWREAVQGLLRAASGADRQRGTPTP